MKRLRRTLRLAVLASSLGPPACSSSGTPAASDAGPDRGGFHVLPDAGTPDTGETGHDGAPDGPPVCTHPLEAGSDADLSCTPGPVDTKCLSRHPTPAHGCSPTQLSTLVEACFGPTQTTTSCGAAQSAFGEVSCVDCIYTQATATAWGPTLLVNPPGGVTDLYVPLPNVGGCIALTDKSNAGRKCALDCRSSKGVRSKPASRAAR
jgi:hypothetical protein